MSNGITTTAHGHNSLGAVLLVDDEDHITGLLKYNLENESYGVSVEPIALKASNSDLTNFRIILVDAMKQSFSGIDFLRTVKANPMTAHIPVIVVSGSDSEDQILSAFEAGADDYIIKPFSLRELIARVKSVLRRNPLVASASTGCANIKAGTLEIDLTTRSVKNEGTPVDLTKTEYAILALLAKNKETYFNRRQIYEEVWASGNFHDNDRIVDTNISRLRKKLGDAGGVIVNKSGKGYTIKAES